MRKEISQTSLREKLILAAAAPLFLLLAYLLAGEIILRLRGDGRYSVTDKEFLLYDRGMGTVFRDHPFLPFGLQPGNYDIGEGKKITINSLGYRGPEFNVAKSDGRRRILYLGDSYVYGYGLDDKDTAPAQLAKLLPGYEVINAGFHGYYPSHYELYLRSEGIALAPDLVIVSLLPDNDLDDQKFQIAGSRDRARDAFEVQGGRRYPRAVVSRLADLPLLRHSLAWYQLLSIAYRAGEAVRQAPMGDAPGKARFESAVMEIHGLMESKRIAVLFLLLPGGSVHAGDENGKGAYVYMRDFLHAHSLPFLDLGPVLLREPLDDMILRFRNELGAYTDLHHNAHANAIVARQLVAYLNNGRNSWRGAR